MMCGRGICCSDENAFDNRSRYQVWFEAANRAASPQEGVQVSCVYQSELA